MLYIESQKSGVRHLLRADRDNQFIDGQWLWVGRSECGVMVTGYSGGTQAGLIDCGRCQTLLRKHPVRR